MGRFDGKTVLVTGGNRNTGLHIVEKFVREGAKVFMCGSSEASTTKGAEALRARGLDGIVSQPCDISDAGQVAALMDTIAREAGRLDVLVNNAANQGLGHGGPLEMNPEMFNDVFKTNVIGGFQVTQAACNRFFMKQESRGAVVFLSSNTAMRAIRNRTAYCASKGAINSMVRALALDLAPLGIRVNCCAPGYINTERWDVLDPAKAALYVGLMVSGLVVAWALGFLGSWRSVFFAFGAAGCALGVIFIWVLKDVSRRDAESQRETNLSASVPLRENSSLSAGLRAYFCNPSALCATAGFVAIVFVNNAYLFWAPKFAAEKFALDVGEVGKGVMLWHHLFAFAAILAGGVITDRFVKRMPRFRLGFQILALLCGAPMLVLIGFAPSFAGLLVSASAYGVFRGFFEVNTHASLFDVVPSQFRSTAVGLLNMIAFFFGGLSGVAMGALSQKWGVRGFEIGFGIMAGTYALGAALMAFSFFFTFNKNRIAE